MIIELRRGLVALAVFTVLCGFAYPLAVWGIGQIAFRGAADGSLVRTGDRVAGSALIGQSFDQPRYFWGRPSAPGYDALASGASNLGPTSAALDEAVRARLAVLLAAHPGATPADVPGELITASGSGLDPHISPEYARLQVDRVAAAHGLGAEAVSSLVDRHTSSGLEAFLGQPSVNVTALNLALAAASQSS